LLSEEAVKPFDLERGPMLRAKLLRLAPQDHVLYLNLHHIVSDGWSMGVLLRELSELYQSYVSGAPISLPGLAIQYADYSVWQRQWLQGAELNRQLSYWRKQLDGVSKLQLPTDRPRPAVQTYRGASQGFNFSAELSKALKVLSQQQGVTQFMTLLAAFKILLSRYSGQTDIAVGAPIAGRTRPEIEGLIGFFVNTLVLRSDLSNDPTVTTLLRQVRETTLDAYGHQDLPFEKLVEDLQPARNMGHSPLFQVMFAYQETGDRELALKPATVQPLRVPGNSAKFDLTLTMSERDGELRGSLNYNTDLFDAATIERVLGHFRNLLEGIVANPEQRISQLPLLSEAEKQQLLIEWNDTKRDYPQNKCVHELFEEQVERTPDAVALVFDDQQLTYRELNHRSNQLAHYLQQHGVGREVLAGVCVERSLEMIVSLLAILKAGGAYVPLDSSYPKERLRFMLADTRASIVLTDNVSLRSLPQTDAQVINLDRDCEEISSQSRDNPSRQSVADDLAYVIYTSGSTGLPKGVQTPHRAIVRLLFGIDYVQLDSAKTLLQMAPISFDAATFEIWGELLHGGKCVLFPGKVPSPRELGEVLKKHQVNTLWLTAALFNMVINEEPQALSEVNQLLIGGEALSVQHVKKGLGLLPNTEIINGYGPTESTTFACCYRIPREFDEGLTSIPIGRPIANTEIYILDSYLNPVPVGVAGEIYIGGDGLARGYLNQAELTAEKFITHSLDGKIGKRLYKTGDIARYLPDGNVEFLGRKDSQVKIRGYRIELGEVEAVLSQHETVQTSVVLVREEERDDKRLVAYVVSRPGASFDAPEARSYLTHKLPLHMIPSVYVLLNELPLTSNGKVDRHALTSTDSIEHGYFDSEDAPRTPIEAVLMEIWCEVLGTKQIGIDNNFFELGGHSLLGIRLVDQICRQFQAEIPLRFLFECPTVKSMAARISKIKADAADDRRATSSHSYLFELKPGKGRQPVFFLPGGFGGDYEFLVYARLVHYAGDDYGFYGLRARSADGIDKAHSSVEQMAADYLHEIRALQPVGPYFLVGNCIGGVVAYEVARQLETAGQTVALLAMMDTVRPSLKRYLRYRWHRVKKEMNNRYGSAAGLFGLRDNYYVARSVYHSKRLRQLPWRKKLPYLLKKTGVAIEESPKLFSSLIPIELNDGRDGVREGYIDTLRRYRPRLYRGRVVMLNNSNAGASDPTLGWKNLVLDGIEVQTIPGNHEAYIRQYVRIAGEKLRACLEKAAVVNRAAMSQTAPTADSVAAQKCGTGLERVIE
jgi:aspartate racemase